MSVQRIASRYAKSLMDLAVEQNKLERVLEDVQSFRATTKVRDFHLLLKSPIVHATKKVNILKLLFGAKYDELTMAFLNIIINKGREPYLPEIADEFVAQYREMKGISSVKLITASAVSAEMLKSIEAKLMASAETDQSVEISTEVDPALIGGFVIEFQDKIYDASIAHNLEALKKEFI
ncbi:MAG: ATP synthase F1 subunit delta [Lewinellaceae bacterium]|nr:ATP synthase F1 subunit delta [Lewinellaceae bacterium]